MSNTEVQEINDVVRVKKILKTKNLRQKTKSVEGDYFLKQKKNVVSLIFKNIILAKEANKFLINDFGFNCTRDEFIVEITLGNDVDEVTPDEPSDVELKVNIIEPKEEPMERTSKVFIPVLPKPSITNTPATMEEEIEHVTTPVQQIDETK